MPPASRVPRLPPLDDPVLAALVVEGAQRSDVVWVEVPGHRARLVWHVWHDAAVHVVVGMDARDAADAGEQRVPGLVDGADVVVVVPAKDKGGRLVTYRARAVVLAPDDPRYAAAADALAAARLNERDPAGQRDRWARQCAVVRLETTGPVLERPGLQPSGSHNAPPPGSPATTRPPLPFLLGRRPRRRRRG